MTSINFMTHIEARQPRGQSAQRAIVEAKQRWSLIGWMAKNLLSRAPPYFGR
jgi:hypothetical protein